MKNNIKKLFIGLSVLCVTNQKVHASSSVDKGLEATGIVVGGFVVLGAGLMALLVKLDIQAANSALDNEPNMSALQKTLQAVSDAAVTQARQQYQADSQNGKSPTLPDYDQVGSQAVADYISTSGAKVMDIPVATFNGYLSSMSGNYITSLKTVEIMSQVLENYRMPADSARGSVGKSLLIPDEAGAESFAEYLIKNDIKTLQELDDLISQSISIGSNGMLPAKYTPSGASGDPVNTNHPSGPSSSVKSSYEILNEAVNASKSDLPDMISSYNSSSNSLLGSYRQLLIDQYNQAKLQDNEAQLEQAEKDITDYNTTIKDSGIPSDDPEVGLIPVG